MAPVVGPSAAVLDGIAAELDHDHLNAIITPLGLCAVASITPMHGGSSPVFKLDLTDGSALVLKVFVDAALDSETYAARLLSGTSLPVTRQLLADASKTLLPFGFTISSYLTGASVSTFSAHADIASLYRQMGSMLRSLHSVAMPAYGRFDRQGIARPATTNEAFITGLLNHAFGQFTHYGADPTLTLRLRRIADDAFPRIVPHSRGAVLAHDDFQPNNLLAVAVDGKLSLTGLIDFGNAHAADALCDLAKCLFCSEHEAPGSSGHILDGYGPIDHPDPSAALAFYTLLHRVIMWWWLRHIGALPTPDTPVGLMDDLRRTATNGL